MEATVVEASNKQITLKNYVSGFPKETDLEVRITTTPLKVPEGTPNTILAKNLYLSCYPYMRKQMSKLKRGSHIDSFIPASPITGLGVAKVIDSTNPEFKKDDLFWGFTGWEEYTLITDTKSLFKIQHTDIPLSYYTGILGMPGLSAYAGFYEICSPKKGEKVFISAAAGAVGLLAGQFAKLLGCYVVGSAETKQKVDLLKNNSGFDKAFKHKKGKDLNAALKRYFPDGIDIYFENNVGGKNIMLETVIRNMRLRGRIAVCGKVPEFLVEKPADFQNMFNFVTKEIQMEGFAVSDYYHLYTKFLGRILPYIKEEKVSYVEDIVEGLENGPAALVGLFSGGNIGKQLVVVVDE